MTTYNPFGYNFITIPKFDIQFMFSNSKSVILRDKYMKYFAFICFVGGIRLSIFLSRYIYTFLKKQYYLMLKSPSQPVKDSYVVILGYGDSDASYQIAAYFAQFGYNLAIVNNKMMIDSRENQIKELQHKYNVKITLLRTDKITEISFTTLKSQFPENWKIDFVFDATLHRHIVNKSAENVTTRDLSITMENMREIHESLNVYHHLFEFFLTVNKGFVVYVMNYLNKESEVNQLLFARTKNGFVSTYAEASQGGIVVKHINLYSNNKLREISFKEVESVHRNAFNSSIQEINFN